MDLDALRNLIETRLADLLQNEYQLSHIGRWAVLLLGTVVLSLFSWMTGKVLWKGARLGGRGLHWCLPGRRSDPLTDQLFQSIQRSLQEWEQPAAEIRGSSIRFANGAVNVPFGFIYLNGENVTSLFPRRQCRALLKQARTIKERLDRRAERVLKLKMLESLNPSTKLPGGYYQATFPVRSGSKPETQVVGSPGKGLVYDEAKAAWVPPLS